MQAAGYEYVIFRRKCPYPPGGVLRALRYPHAKCAACGDEFGFNVPVVMYEGRPSRHLSCAIEWQLVQWWPQIQAMTHRVIGGLFAGLEPHRYSLGKGVV